MIGRVLEEGFTLVLLDASTSKPYTSNQVQRKCVSLCYSLNGEEEVPRREEEPNYIMLWSSVGVSFVWQNIQWTSFLQCKFILLMLLVFGFDAGGWSSTGYQLDTHKA